MKQNIRSSLGPVLGDFLGLVVRQTVDTGTHDHRRRRDLVDPAGIVTGAGNDVLMGIAQPLSGALRTASTQVLSNSTGSKPPTFSNSTSRPMSSQIFLAPAFKRIFHVLDDRKVGRAKVDGEDRLAGDDIARIRKHFDVTGRADGVRGVGPGDFVNQVQDPGHAETGILAHRHRRGACVAVLAGDGDLGPGEALAVSDNADVLAFGFQDRALLDMQFEHGVHLVLAGADFLVAHPADALQFVAEFLAVVIFTVIGPILGVDAGKDTRTPAWPVQSACLPRWSSW